MPRVRKTPKSRGVQPDKSSRFNFIEQDTYHETTVNETPLTKSPFTNRQSTNLSTPGRKESNRSQITFPSSSNVPHKTSNILNETFIIENSENSYHNINSSRRKQQEKQRNPEIPPLEARGIDKRKIISRTQFIEINRKLNQSSIPIGPFIRILKGIITDLGFGTIKFNKTAVQALQVACEDIITEMFQFSILCSTHRQRVTVTVADFRLVQLLRKDLVPWMTMV
ncbi:hypothetical protein SNEBB_010845 [Seison nebaliae]|nr:hypothetical protein SNEBB_010845 [Seison nebaliae]